MELLRKKRFWAILLIPATALLLHMADRRHETVEALYSSAVYPLLAGVFGRISSFFPFSVSEFLLIGLILFAICRIVSLARRVRRDKAGQKQILARFFANVCCIAGVGYFVWAMVCGLNYQRLTFAQLSGLDVRPSSATELRQLSEDLAAATNAARANSPK